MRWGTVNKFNPALIKRETNCGWFSVFKSFSQHCSPSSTQRRTKGTTTQYISAVCKNERLLGSLWWRYYTVMRERVFSYTSKLKGIFIWPCQICGERSAEGKESHTKKISFCAFSIETSTWKWRLRKLIKITFDELKTRAVITVLHSFQSNNSISFCGFTADTDCKKRLKAWLFWEIAGSRFR